MSKRSSSGRLGGGDLQRPAPERLRGRAWISSPSARKREPWQGQSHDFSASLHWTMQPSCVQRADTARSSPAASRDTAMCPPLTATTLPLPRSTSSAETLPRSVMRSPTNRLATYRSPSKWIEDATGLTRFGSKSSVHGLSRPGIWSLMTPPRPSRSSCPTSESRWRRRPGHRRGAACRCRGSGRRACSPASTSGSRPSAPRAVRGRTARAPHSARSLVVAGLVAPSTIASSPPSMGC
jgi:hypothetical protein